MITCRTGFWHRVSRPITHADFPVELGPASRPSIRVAFHQPRRSPSLASRRLLPPAPGAPTSSAGYYTTFVPLPRTRPPQVGVSSQNLPRAFASSRHHRVFCPRSPLRGTPSFIARRHDVDVNDIDLEEEELDTDDLEAAGCAVCALGAHRPRLPVAPQAQLPASGAPVHSVTALVADAHTLQRENQELRAQYELVSAHNAGLATHASVLHDCNLAILHRACEGYRAGMIRLEQALLSREHAERDYAVLEDRVADFRPRAERADAAEALLRAERGSLTEQYRDRQAQLRAARDQVTDLTAQLARAPATPPPSTVSLARLFAAQGERDAALAEHAAVAERDQARQALTALEQQRAPVDEELCAARASLSQSRMEIEAAQNLNVPLRDDLRRVNALLVAHAEELRRGATRIHELEESVATATTLRVAAESEMARAQAGELCATSRTAQYRAGWLSMRRSSQQRRGAVGAQTHRLSARVAELVEERDLAIRERDERAVAWRRMLRDARRGRELARRVRDELADRLAGVVTRVGGQIDTAALVRRLEATFTAEIDGAIPLPPAIPTSAAVPVASAVPVPAPTASSSGARAGSSASTAGSTTGASPPAGPSGSRPVPTSSAA
ncbi:hypothetical protein PHYSODRAFT_530344, partial [Phytophthora sojae]